MSFKSILKPTKEKIILDLLISMILIALSISLPQLGIQHLLSQMGLLEKIFNTLMSFIITLIIYYPLTTGLLYLYKIITKERHPYKKPEKLNKKDLAIALFFILILNPVSISLIYSAAVYLNNDIIHKPCGLEIIRFTDDSPAQSAGIRPGEVIIDINNNPIKTKEDFLSAIKNELPGKYIVVKTAAEDYRVKLAQDPITKKNIIGIVVKEKVC
ncbi:MAG TPA: PDZ domain-containing protein [Candidatus Nanoarchaeia archaeon]|nr:PDZ domain-containing protein [Candidatus Nanoarchaeia archaeon]